MSPIWTLILTALGGILGGLAMAAIPLCWFYEQLKRASWHAAAAEKIAGIAADQARRDDTTGLPNRRAFLEQLQRALAVGDPIGVVMIDLDDFKTVNDTFSHEAGNDLLTGVGLRLAGLPAPVRLAARLSGDEFVLLVAGDTEQTRASARAAWRAIISQPIPVAQGTDWKVRASVGYATDGTSARDLLTRADAAMYQAKAAGGGVCDSTAVTAPPALPARIRCRDAHRHS
ncbi:GGDEF domain-containing protein [Actinoplanes sp. NPDC049668]|uniref:GGDEF domain-containing protein n=1 Tax=unclassified Actinoplanes TaxID=2626549 RepID=UPI0033B44B24